MSIFGCRPMRVLQAMGGTYAGGFTFLFCGWQTGQSCSDLGFTRKAIGQFCQFFSIYQAAQPFLIKPTIELGHDNQKPEEFEEIIHLAGCFHGRWKYGLPTYHKGNAAAKLSTTDCGSTFYFVIDPSHGAFHNRN